MTPRWIDTHAHLADDSFDETLAAVLDRAAAAGVETIVVVGTTRADSEKAIRLAERHPMLHATVGLHPNNLNEIDSADWPAIEAMASHSRVMGVGETGLDRYWKTVPIELQREYFDRHLDLGARVGKPVIVHCREAMPDILEAFTSFAARCPGPIKGIMHSFTGDATEAAACLDLGLDLSFAGMLTYKKNESLRQVAATVPRDRIMVETDSPYLSPEPIRGRRNEPANVALTGAKLAAALGLPVEEVASLTTAAAKRVFGLDDSP